MPFYAAPSDQAAYVIFVYKNFRANNPNMSHVGLGVNATHCAKVLRGAGVRADLRGIWTVDDIDRVLVAAPDCTHLVIQAPWIAVSDLVSLIRRHPQVHFVVRVHSQVAFLQADRAGIANIRGMLPLQESEMNLTVSCNNTRINDFLSEAYAANCLYLPNMYAATDAQPPPWRPPGVKDVIRVGSFGALRVQKNHVTGAAAALLIARRLGIRLQFFVSTEREPGGTPILDAIRGLYDGLSWAQVVSNPWQDWPAFRRTVAGMDLCIQLSNTESFNITTADAACVYVPSVVSDPIEWVPHNWHADADDPGRAADVGIWLLSNQYAGRDGRRSLVDYNSMALGRWLDYLASNPTV